MNFPPSDTGSLQALLIVGVSRRELLAIGAGTDKFRLPTHKCDMLEISQGVAKGISGSAWASFATSTSRTLWDVIGRSGPAWQGQ